MATLAGTFRHSDAFDADYAMAPFGPADALASAVVRAGIWRRFYNAILDSRRIAAEREIARHAHLIALNERDGRVERSALPF